jgi:hypothetical protein
MSPETTSVDDLPIACDPSALTDEQQARWMIVGKQLYPAIQEVRDLPDGYAFRLPNDAATLLLIAEDLSFERLCCPFLRFTLEVEPGHGPVWLSFTGGEGAKEFLRISFESANLLDEAVARAAGFNVVERKDMESLEDVLKAVDITNERYAQVMHSENA